MYMLLKKSSMHLSYMYLKVSRKCKSTIQLCDLIHVDPFSHAPLHYEKSILSLAGHTGIWWTCIQQFVLVEFRNKLVNEVCPVCYSLPDYIYNEVQV